MAYSRLPSSRSPFAILTLAGMPLLAFAADKHKSIQQLDTITVQGQPAQHEDTTGMARIQKTSEDLAKDQVIGIRDLLRYDPGISVNESGGRGTSSGYSMRGVDKDRVAVAVDGMAQAQTLLRQGFGMVGKGQGRSSGAQNEIEFENLSMVGITQGSGSVMAGSGALGGAVLMQTKEVQDFIHGDKDWGVHSKTTYSGKDGRLGQTLGLGGRTGALEGFVQHTRRKGHEIRPHQDIYRYGGGQINRYRLDGTGIEPETLSAKDISGPDRKAPNPMQYRSASWLSRLGYHFTPEHYTGLVMEHTRQHYDVRGMFERNYWSHIEEDSIYRPSGNLEEFSYIPTRYYYDTHQYIRRGVEYKFLPQDGARWTDQLKLRLDRQSIRLDSAIHSLNCSPYPHPDPRCTSRPDNIGSRAHYVHTRYTQTLNRFDISSHKVFGPARRHDLWINAGFNATTTFISDHDASKHAYREFDAAQSVVKSYFSQYNKHYASSPIKGRHFFLAVHDNVRLGEYWRLGVGGRYDRTAFNAAPDIFDDQVTQQWSGKTGLQHNTYENYSWDLGLVFHLTSSIDLAYKTSSGFRVPTVGELLGPSFNYRGERLTQPRLEAEKSLMHEFGVTTDNRYGSASASYFFARYDNLIDIAVPKPHLNYPPGHAMYYNLQSVRTEGLTFRSLLDMHQIWQRMPDGLQATLAMSYVKPRGPASRNPDFQGASSYVLDMLQPIRLVYGLEYLAPDERWGVSLKTTYSGSKKAGELVYESVSGGIRQIGSSKTDIRTRKWMVTDLTGHYQINNMLLLRLGAYNVFNYRYVTWESARQAGFRPIGNSLERINHLALAAPGRNYTATLEFKY